MRKKSMDELDRVDVDTYQAQEKIPIVLLLDNIRSAMNVGSAFRTADGFGIEEIILTGITAQPPSREILKTAIGAEKSVKWSYYKDPIEAIEIYKKKDYKICGVEQIVPSKSLEEASKAYNKLPLLLIFGNELSGISDDVIPHLDNAIEIKQFGTKHSFNISVCLGIVLWEFSKAFRTI